MLGYIMLSIALFTLGTFGMFLTRTHIIIMLISLELILLAVNINFVIFSLFLDDSLGQIYSILVLTVAQPKVL